MNNMKFTTLNSADAHNKLFILFLNLLTMAMGHVIVRMHHYKKFLGQILRLVMFT